MSDPIYPDEFGGSDDGSHLLPKAVTQAPGRLPRAVAGSVSDGAEVVMPHAQAVHLQLLQSQRGDVGRYAKLRVEEISPEGLTLSRQRFELTMEQLGLLMAGQVCIHEHRGGGGR